MVEEVINQAQKLLVSAGKTFLSVKFPRDFELYFCSFELCSYEGELIDYFSFPIMPNSITKKEPYISNIKKTFGGITVIKNPDFVPQEISIRGSFGKSFKILGGKELINFFGVSKFQDSEDYSKGTFSNIVKTGYGAIKYLQGILERSKKFDGSSRLPRVLYFHNSSLGESYLVEPNQVQFEQNLASNMIWSYTLSFTILQNIDYGRMGTKATLKNSKTVDLKKALVSSATSSVIGSIGEGILSTGISLVK